VLGCPSLSSSSPQINLLGNLYDEVYNFARRSAGQAERPAKSLLRAIQQVVIFETLSATSREALAHFPKFSA
jgi:hypothetical protein